MIEGGPGGVSNATRNAWQAIEFNSTRRDQNGTFSTTQGAPQSTTSQNPGSPNIFLQNNQKVAVRANAVNVSTKLQQQIMTIPDGSKNSQGNKSRHSPREYSES